MKRLATIVSATVGVLAIVTLYARHGSARSLRDVASKTAAGSVRDGLPTLWFVFRPSDCMTNAARFDTLNALAVLGRINVRGIILLDEPGAGTDIERMLPLFRAEFAILPDAHGDWRNAADHEGLRPPFYALQNSSGDVAILAPGELVPGTAAFSVLAGDASRFEQQLWSRRTQGANHRHFLAAALERDTSSSEGGESLSQPERLIGARHRIAMYDFGRAHVTVATDAGQLLWTYPAAGDSIEPFASVSDIKMWQDSVGVLDNLRHQIVVLSPAGQEARTLKLSRPVSRFAPITEGRTVGIDESMAAMRVYVFSASGQVLKEIAVPQTIARLPSLVREARLVTLPGSDSVLVAFRNASQIWIMNPRDGLRPFTLGPEQVGFPAVVSFRGRGRDIVQRLDPRAVRASTAVQADENSIYVLFAGEAASANQQIDVFARSNGAYRGSYRLTTAATDMARVTGGFVTLAALPSLPSPSLIRWHETEASGQPSTNVATRLPQ
jgi:hypothetical protein